MVGQSEWSEHFPECGGSSQSPVDVVTTQTKYDARLTPLTPLGYGQHGNRPFTLYNNGHTGNHGNACFFFFFLKKNHVRWNNLPLQLLSSCQTGWPWAVSRGSSRPCRCTFTGAVAAPVPEAVNTPSTAKAQKQRYAWNGTSPLTGRNALKK